MIARRTERERYHWTRVRSRWPPVTPLVLLLLATCGRDEADESLRESLTDRFKKASVEAGAVRVDEETAFEWERMLFWCPYTARADIEERLGFEWEDYPGDLKTDTQVRVIFVRDGNVTRWAALPRHSADACGVKATVSDELQPTDALIVRKEADGFLTLHDAPAA